MSPRLSPLFFRTDDMSLEALTSYAEGLCGQQRDVNWHLGDAVRKAKSLLGSENWSQAFPEWYSVGHLSRCEAVALAYPNREDRNELATWTQHMQVAGKPDRIDLVAAMVEKGQTSDESRKAKQKERIDKSRWLLAIDVNYHVTRMWASGAETEAAKGVSEWIKRTVSRLSEKGLTDCVCCLDSKVNFRKELTKDWEDNYKPRATKDPELANQLQLAEEMLTDFCCVKQEGFEADDLLASYAKQFEGRVTLLTVDKDMRQCLSATCNMLIDVEWHEDETSGAMLPEYKWVTAKDHSEGCTYNGVAVTGITPAQWTSFQTLAGDSSDGVSGASGIGAKIAADLIKEFGTVEAAIQAAKDEDERIKPKKREALIAFEPRLEVTRQLVTLRDDLVVPSNTRI